MRFLSIVATVACTALPALAHAQATAPGNGRLGAGPPARVLGPALSSTTELLSNPTQVRALPGGRVLVNDGPRRRLLLLDSAMQLIKVVADSQSAVNSAYGINPGRLLAYHGDSSLLLDAQTLSMLVIDGDGNIVKVKAVPRSDHVTYLASSLPTYGNPGFDAKGRLLYRIADPSSLALSLALGGGVVAPQMPDSAPILRLDLDTRKLDTAGKVKIQKRPQLVTQSATGGISIRTAPANPMPTSDDWTVTADGSLALLRHRDYSIDWLRPDGHWESTAPMPFDWQRLTDDHKKAFVDSVRIGLENSRKLTLARYDSINHVCFDLPRTMGPEIPKETRVALRTPPARAAAAGAESRTTTVVDGRGAAGRGAPVPPGISLPPAPTCPTEAYPPAAVMYPTPPAVIPYAELPDYKPPFSTAAGSAIRGDADGNVWIRVNQMKPVPGALLYDIADSKGELIDRIQIPAARALVGFAPGNIVYVMTRTSVPPVVKLERVRWR